MKKSNNSKQPLVSISIPVYNAEKTIAETIQSIINQTYNNLEIIIVDNASTDNTLQVIKKFKDPRIKIYKNNKNIGAEKNFSKCVKLAKGRYIAIFHADDVYTKNMIKKQVEVFQNNPNIAAVFTRANKINSSGEIIGESRIPSHLKNKKCYHFYEIFTSILENGNFLVTPSVMVKSEIYKKMIPFNEKKFDTSADLDMWLRILEKHPIAIIDEKLMSYRISYEQGSYQLRKTRTEEADFFKVMNYYLSKFGTLEIPPNILKKYELLIQIDKIRCAINFLVKNKSEDAKKLLKNSLSIKLFKMAIRNDKKIYFTTYFIIGVILLLSIFLKIGYFSGKILHCLRYKWKMRYV